MSSFNAPSDPMDQSDSGMQVLQVDPGLAEQMAGAQIDRLIETAKRFPRSIATVKNQATELATIDVESASACTYAIPRGNKTITGPTVKFAKIIASSWGNLWVQTTPIAEDKRFVTVRAVAWDVEKNVCLAVDVKRRITDKHGKTYNDDMIGVTISAATSVAFRNAVLLVVPDAFTNSIHNAARQVARGDATTLQERRDRMFGHFASLGVDDLRIFQALGVDSRDEIGLDEFEVLQGIASAIKWDGMEIDTVFPNVRDGQAVQAAGGTKTEQLAAQLRAKKSAANGEIDSDPEPDSDPDPDLENGKAKMDAVIAEEKRKQAHKEAGEAVDNAVVGIVKSVLGVNDGEPSDEEKAAIIAQETKDAQVDSPAEKPKHKPKSKQKPKTTNPPEPNFLTDEAGG